MRRYEFLSAWLLEARRSEVWSAIEDASAWPEWWRGVISSEELDRGREDGVGRRYRVRWRSAIPYALQFDFLVDDVDPPARMAGRAVGELSGTGVWRLSENHGVTVVTYEWRVATTVPWMNFVAPVAAPVFAWNHDWVMARGAEGLAERIGARLIASS
jgi:Polyketide cyclase / dehydrase and lipid transport